MGSSSYLLNGVVEVSLIKIDAVAPLAVTVRVSDPSVKLSFSKVTEMVAMPFELITALPLSAPPDTSAELMPEMVYGTDVPEATFVAVRLKDATEPSLTEEEIAESK